MPASETVSLDIERHTLDNGLKVVLHRDTALPLVAVNLWYHVGSQNESPGRTGFAHLFEHLLFQGSENVDVNGHFRHVQQAGGSANGSTWFDRTNYHAVLPAHQLELGLWLESDRMGFFLPAITSEKLENQRAVVINERHQRIDNQPYGRAFERLQELLYPREHPYSWPVIGYEDDLRAATLDEVREFFRTHYVPSNSVLTVAGDLDPATTLDLVARYFEEIPAGSPPPRPRIPIPAGPPGARREILHDRVQLPRIYMAFVAPPFGERSWYAADLLAVLLCEGKSSRLYRDLVYERELAQDVSCFILPTELAATFALVATVRPDVEVAVLEDALREVLRRAASTPPTPEELERARNQLVTSYISRLQSLESRADLLSQHTTFFDAPERVTEEPAMYRSLSAADVVDFAAEYLTAERGVVVTVLPEETVLPDETALLKDGGAAE